MSRNNESPWTYWLLWTMLAVMVGVFPVYAWHRNTSGFLTDDGMYLMMADFFSPYYHRNYLVEHLIMAQSRFPPALPMLIGLLGGGSQNMPAAHMVVVLTFILSAVALYAWARRTLGARDLAAGCLLIYALLPLTLVYVLEIWSEYLYMAMVFWVLIILDGMKRSGRHSREMLCACALVIGLSMLTRMVGMALLAAFVVYLYVNAIRRKYLYVLVALVLPLCWQAVKLTDHYHGGYSEDLVRYLSLHGMATLLMHDMPHMVLLLMRSWEKHFSVTSGSSWPAHIAALALLAAALIGLARRAADRRVDFFYVLFYVAIVLVWPYPAHSTRFLYPLVPLALVYAFIGLSDVARKTRIVRRSWLHTGLMLLMLIMIYPNVLFVANRFLAPVPRYIPEDYRHTRQWLRGRDLKYVYRDADDEHSVVRLLRRIGKHVPPDQCVYAAHPVSAMLYSDREAIIVRHASIDKMTSCDYLFVMNLSAGKKGPDYPLFNVDTSRLSLLDSERNHFGRPQAFLFRIEH